MTHKLRPVLLVEGHTHLLSKQTLIAMVGARNASVNGRRFAYKSARKLSDECIVGVSGLAAGIDAAAHQGALKTGTIGGIAGGPDHVYPPENAGLYDQLREQGAIVTEMPVGTPIKPQLFPRRNRIVSGLSQGVIVVEAAPQSGSLITARLAGEQGREVMAIPGSPMDPRAAGTNRLIKDGAILVEGAQDVLNLLRQQRMEESDLPLFSAQLSHKIDENQVDRARQRLLDGLAPTPTPVDELIRLCDFPAPTVWGGERVVDVLLDGWHTSEPGDPHVPGGHAVTTLRTAVLAREGPPRDARELDALTCDCCSTDAARDGAGHAVGYRDRTAEEVRDVHWLVRGSNGWTAPRPVHADGWKIADCPVNGPALATVAGGHVAPGRR